jgi:hypothetical protein
MLIDLPHINSSIGFLGFIQNSDPNLKFKIERVYFLSSVPSDAVRGSHGHLELQQILIPVSGSFDLKVINKDGEVTQADVLKGRGVAMKKGGTAKNWIQSAIKKPGALRKALGAKAGQPIPAKKLAAAAKKPGKMGQRARLAQTLKKMK